MTLLTDLSEAENLEQIADKAILERRMIKLEDLSMVPWTRELPFSSTYPMKSTKDIEHYNFAYEVIASQILSGTNLFFGLERTLSNVIAELFKNAYEHAERVNSSELKVAHTEFGKLPMEIIVFGQTKEISPVFAKYWKYQKDFVKEHDGLADTITGFYEFAAMHGFNIRPDSSNGNRNFGHGLTHMMSVFNNCNFYKTPEDELLCYVQFDGKSNFE